MSVADTSEVILLRVAGSDRRGLTLAFSELLAQHGIAILDIGQSVIHEQLNLGMLIELPPGAQSSSVLKDLLFKGHEMGVSVQFTPVSAADYEHWVGGQGKKRYIVTLLARKITAVHFARMAEVVAEQGLNIDDIVRLSGRVPLGQADAASRACVEISLRGDPVDADVMRSRFVQAAADLDVDIAFQEDTLYRRNRRLICFDMDSTLIETEVIDELAAAAGVGAEVAAITERAMQGELDFQQSFRQRMALLRGLDESVLAEVAARLPITEGAERLIRHVRALGYKTAILSGGFTYFGEYLQRQLGIDYVYANQLTFDADGRLTGEVTTPIVDGQRKADLLREIAAREQISLEQVIAVGDGANDLPMLHAAGLGIAFRAKPIVQQNARQALSTMGLDGILYLLGFKEQHQLTDD
ncbi:phosphoserine phosphatase SerB [Natronospirillum operosum]|uniref:Phosphoserine phosphatase n=1 Tax=Natronospirillum operosum TaxID=2759953 RepID=A0A4Z0W7M2_9GAMM|nr:phosphoserine phosphatase SerB [Natronospirillum operosum]TGG94064.1 phosphoserine phosphatase SerB [Natronospirillum operosum]